MARYTGPVNKKMRFLGLEIAKKSGKNRMSPRRRLSPYGLQLREKQKARFLYGILERQFRNYYDKASNIEGSTGDELLILLEKRFDNVMFRTGMFNTRRQSRQAVNHAHFVVNGRKVNIPSFQVSQGDKIEWTEKGKKTSLFEIAQSNSKTIPTPHWIDLEQAQMSTTVVTEPMAEDGEPEIDTTQIVEFYSK